MDNLYELTGLIHGDHIGVVIYTWIVAEERKNTIKIRRDGMIRNIQRSDLNRIYSEDSRTTHVFCSKEMIDELEKVLLAYTKSLVGTH